MNKLMDSRWSIWANIIVLVCILGWADWMTGEELHFFLFYFIPVGFAGWFLGRGAHVAVAVACAMVWFAADLLAGHAYSSHAYPVWNTVIRLGSFLVIGLSTRRIHLLLDAERAVAEALRRSLAEIKVLEGLLRICAECKRIKDANGTWQKLETYVSDHSRATFTHGYCPECARKFLHAAGLGEGVDGSFASLDSNKGTKSVETRE
jgi:hypothetical protein